MSEANVAKEFTNLFAGHVDPMHQKQMHQLLATGETITDCINRAKNLALDLKAAKKDRTNFNFEDFKAKVENFNTWLEKTKSDFPGYFKDIESPFGDNLQEVDSKKFLSNIEEIIEKTQELIARHQSQLPLLTLNLQEKESMFKLICEIMTESLKQCNRSKNAIVHNQRSQ